MKCSEDNWKWENIGICVGECAFELGKSEEICKKAEKQHLYRCNNYILQYKEGKDWKDVTKNDDNAKKYCIQNNDGPYLCANKDIQNKPSIQETCGYELNQIYCYDKEHAFFINDDHTVKQIDKFSDKQIGSSQNCCDKVTGVKVFTSCLCSGHYGICLDDPNHVYLCGSDKLTTSDCPKCSTNKNAFISQGQCSPPPSDSGYSCSSDYILHKDGKPVTDDDAKNDVNIGLYCAKADDSQGYLCVNSGSSSNKLEELCECDPTKYYCLNNKTYYCYGYNGANKLYSYLSSYSCTYEFDTSFHDFEIKPSELNEQFKISMTESESTKCPINGNYFCRVASNAQKCVSNKWNDKDCSLATSKVLALRAQGEPSSLVSLEDCSPFQNKLNGGFCNKIYDESNNPLNVNELFNKIRTGSFNKLFLGCHGYSSAPEINNVEYYVSIYYEFVGSGNVYYITTTVPNTEEIEMTISTTSNE